VGVSLSQNQCTINRVKNEKDALVGSGLRGGEGKTHEFFFRKV